MFTQVDTIHKTSSLYIQENDILYFMFIPFGFSIEMAVPSQGHYGFHSFPVVD